MSGWVWVSTPRRRGRWYVAVMLAIIVVVGRSAADDDRHRRRATTMEICQRDPPDIRVDSMPGDHGFRIQILGHAVRYTPGQVYTVSVSGSYTDQTLEGFMLVAVPLNAQDETTAMGTFQHMDADETRFVTECPHVVTEVTRRPRSNVELIWTAPPSRAGCIEFRATVIERGNMWFRDDGALTRVFCEDTRTTEGRRPPELVPDCCACSTAKYEMTFEGHWSQTTHPKDYPTQRRLLHWSNIVGASHSRNYIIWQYGDYASRGVREVCEFGYPRSVQDEIDQHSREVRSVMKTTGIWWSNPEGLVQNRTARFSTDRRRHLMSLITMLGPSPDCCVGVSALDMCLSNCTWSGDRTIELYPWDAGTDSGITYMSPNARTDPQQKIRRITDTWPSDARSPFYGIRPQQPLAKLHIRRLSAQVTPPPASGSSTSFRCQDTADEDLTEAVDDPFTGLTEMEKQKLMMMQQQDGGKCALTAWADWSACSVTCGVGQRVRKRSYLNPMVDENMCGQPVMESENCIGLENVCETVDEDCAVTHWSSWSPCSVTCGKGTSQRLRYYLNKEDMVRCQRQTEETQMCVGDVLDCEDARRRAQSSGVCSQRMSVGPCRGSFVRWYYDTDTRRCRKFTYGGCRGNGNRFDSAEQCRRTCEQPDVDVDVSLATSTPTTHSLPGGRCELPAEVGPCRGSIRRWYHDTAMRKCLPFTYGGCRGNANRFETEYQCTAACVLGGDREPAASRDLRTSTTATRYQAILPPARRDHSAETQTTTSSPRRGRQRRQRRVNCVMSSWSSWTSCPTSCDAGLTWTTRQRHVVRHPEHGGRACPRRLRRRRRCRPPAHCAADEAGNANLAATRENQSCQYSEWSDWSPCSRSCGSGGVQERQRRLLNVDDQLRTTCGATLRLRRRMCSNLPPCNAADSHTSRHRRRNADISRQHGY